MRVSATSQIWDQVLAIIAQTGDFLGLCQDSSSGPTRRECDDCVYELRRAGLVHQNGPREFWLTEEGEKFCAELGIC